MAQTAAFRRQRATEIEISLTQWLPETLRIGPSNGTMFGVSHQNPAIRCNATKAVRCCAEQGCRLRTERDCFVKFCKTQEAIPSVPADKVRHEGICRARQQFLWSGDLRKRSAGTQNSNLIAKLASTPRLYHGSP